MQKRIFTLISCVFLAGITTVHAGKQPPADLLRECLKKQVPHDGQLLQLQYEERQHQLYHSFEPWQTLDGMSTGAIWTDGDRFLQLDTVMNNGKPLVSKVQYTGTKSELLEQPYWSNKIANPTQSELESQLLEQARYSPASLVRYFVSQNAHYETGTPGTARYTAILGDAHVSLYIGPATKLVERVVYTRNDDIRGDVVTTISYADFARKNGLQYAQKVIIEKIHGIKDTVAITASAVAQAPATVLVRPEGYKILPDKQDIPAVTVEKLRDHIYNIGLPHTESTTCLAEFKDFFVVIDAPLNSANGELVLAEAQKIAPGKPVKYYAFSHHHPWGVGGMRAFIHKGATVFCVPQDTAYVRFIAAAPHTLKPDSLELDRKTLKTELVNGSKTISDAETELKILYIGGKSEHTADYMIFYFPKEKLLFENDLAWVAKDGPVKKSSKRQSALYHAIKDLGIEVDTVIQQWPVGERYGLKSVIPFSELEQAATMK